MKDAFLEAATKSQPSPYGDFQEAVSQAQKLIADFNAAINYPAYVEASHEKHAEEKEKYKQEHGNVFGMLAPRSSNVTDAAVRSGIAREYVERGDIFGGDGNVTVHKDITDPAKLYAISIPVISLKGRDPEWTQTRYPDEEQDSLTLKLLRTDDGIRAKFVNNQTRRAGSCSYDNGHQSTVESQLFDLSNAEDRNTISQAFGDFWNKAAGGVGADINSDRLWGFFQRPSRNFDNLMASLSESQPERPEQKARPVMELGC